MGLSRTLTSTVTKKRSKADIASGEIELSAKATALFMELIDCFAKLEAEAEGAGRWAATAYLRASREEGEKKVLLRQETFE